MSICTAEVYARQAHLDVPQNLPLEPGRILAKDLQGCVRIGRHDHLVESFRDLLARSNHELPRVDALDLAVRELDSGLTALDVGDLVG